MATLEEKVAAIRASRPANVPQVSIEDKVAAIRARRASPEAVTTETPMAAPIDPNSASSAIGRGVDNLQATLGGGLEAIGEATGSEFLTEAGSQYREEQLAEASQYGTPAISSYKQVDFSAPEQVGEYLKQMGLSAVPSLGVMGAGAATGATAGSFAGPKGKAIGGMLGAVVSALPINIGDVQNAIKEIDPEAKSPWASILGGAAISSLDIVGLGSIAKPLIKTFGKDVAYNMLKEQGVAKEAATAAIKGAIGESSTEAASEGIKAIVAAEGTDTNVNTEKLIEDAINSAVGGGIAGGGLGGVSGTIAANENNQMVAGGGAPTASFQDGRKTPLNMAQRLWDAGGSEATALLEPLARNAPEIEGFIRKLRPDVTGETASGKTIFEDAELMVGNWRGKIEEGLRGEDVDSALADYLDGGSSKGAAAIRGVLGDVLNTAKKDAGLEVGTIKDYLPTRLDKDAIAKDPQAFLQDIAPFVKNPQAALDNWMTEQSVDRGNSVPKVDKAVSLDANGNWVAKPQFQRSKDPETFRYKFAQGTVPPEFGNLEKNRSFASVPQKVLEKYTKEQSGSDKLDAIKDYFEGAAHRIAFAKEFGPGGEKFNFKVVKGIKEAQAKGYNPSKQEVDRMYDLLDAYNGMYGRIETEGLKTLQSVAGAALTIKTLPLTLLSSLVEVALPSIRGDLKSAIVEIVPTIAQLSHDVIRQVFKKVPRTEFSNFAAAANITLQAATNVAASRLGTNMFNRGSAAVLEKFFLANGLTLWTHATSVYAAKTADHIFKRNLYDLSSGLPVSSAKGSLAANQLRSMGVPVYTNEDAMVLFNPQTQSQRETANAYRVLAIKRFKDQTVLQPNIADTPMWMSNGHWQMVAMLKRYPAAFGNLILPQIARKFRPSWAGSRTGALKGATSAMFIISFMLTVGYMQDELKLIAKNGELDGDDKRTEGQRFVDVLNSTMSNLQISLLTDFVAAPRYGTSSVAAVLGPAAGLVDESFKTINSVMEDPKEGEIWKWLYKQTPAAFYRPGREAAGDVELEDMFD